VAREPAHIVISGALVSELCALQGIPLADGDAEAVAAIYAEYVDLIAAIEATELEPETAPPLRLVVPRFLDSPPQPPGNALPGPRPSPGPQ
jgi:hypothetical protein